MPLSPLASLQIDESDRMDDVNEILFRPTVQPVCAASPLRKGAGL
jgi:hypothetical protein